MVDPANRSIFTSTADDCSRGTKVGLSTGLMVAPLVKAKVIAQKIALDKMAGQSSHVSLTSAINPRNLYKGSSGFVLVFTTSTATQTTIHGILEEQPLVATAAAGAASSIFGGTAENLMIQQKKQEAGLRKTVAHTYTTHGVRGLFRGVPMTAIREFFFAGGYLEGVGRTKKALQEQGVEEKKAQILGGMIAGSVAAFLSQPFDTMKSGMQWDFNKTLSLRNIFHKKAFAGFLPRCALVTSAITWMGYANDQLKEKDY